MRIRRICYLTNLGTTPLVSSEAVMEWERCPFSLGNIILLKEKGGMRESFPRQVDKESRGPQGERGLEFSRRKKGQTFFPSLHSLGLYISNVSCLRTVSGLNLLANSVILKCKLWEYAKSLQSCPTLCDPIDSSPPGSPVPGSLQARTLEWVAISFSNAWKWKVKVKSLSCVRLLATP